MLTRIVHNSWCLCTFLDQLEIELYLWVKLGHNPFEFPMVVDELRNQCAILPLVPPNV
jgi:hypothetical protein